MKAVFRILGFRADLQRVPDTDPHWIFDQGYWNMAINQGGSHILQDDGHWIAYTIGRCGESIEMWRATVDFSLPAWLVEEGSVKSVFWAATAEAAARLLVCMDGTSSEHRVSAEYISMHDAVNYFQMLINSSRRELLGYWDEKGKQHFEDLRQQWEIWESRRPN